MYSTRTEQQTHLCTALCVRVHTRQIGQRAGAYINHKLSSSGSCTSNEMAQIKVCLWVLCVSVRVNVYACVLRHCL